MKKIIPFVLFILLIFFINKNIKGSSVSAPYSAGDIILSDGSIVKAEDFSSIDNSNPPIAIAAKLQDDGTILGLGVHRSEEPLPWETDETAPSDARSDAVTDENSPAFLFIDTYSENYISNNDYTSGWYMPDISELCAIYENREEINASLSKIYSLDEHAAMDGLGTNWYWSSTQSETQEDYGWFVHFFNGYSSDCPKNFTNLHVLAVRAF